MTPNEVAEAARKKVEGSPELEKTMRDLWELIKFEISASPKKWKAYELQNADRAARLELLTAFVEGDDPETCGKRARAKVGLVK